LPVSKLLILVNQTKRKERRMNYQLTIYNSVLDDKVTIHANRADALVVARMFIPEGVDSLEWTSMGIELYKTGQLAYKSWKFSLTEIE
jgi:hypothetical protein